MGVSGFRIDLGVVHPDAPGRYLAGVECDGATYHRQATARDLDRLRESILVKLAGGFEEFGAPNGGMTRKKPAKNFINV